MTQELEIDRRFLIGILIGAIGIAALIFVLNRYDHNQRVVEITEYFESLEESKSIVKLKDLLINLDTTSKEEKKAIYKLVDAINNGERVFQSYEIIVENAEDYSLIPFGQYQYHPNEIRTVEKLPDDIMDKIELLKERGADPYAVRRQLEIKGINSKVLYPIHLNGNRGIFLSFTYYGYY